MILADKIIRLRKKNGWSQEELAEKMNVSRQAVSKWEGAQTIPDLEKILKLGELFGVTIDYLLKDEIENEDYTDGVSDPGIRKITLAEANEYLELRKMAAKRIAIATMLCIIAVFPLLLLGVASEYPNFGWSEELACGVGLVFLFPIVAIAVTIFIRVGFTNAPYEFIEKEPFETEYGVVGLVKDAQKKYRICDIFFSLIVNIVNRVLETNVRRQVMDRAEYVRTVETYANDIYRVAFCYCRNKSDAEDIVQSVFLKLLQAEQEFQDELHKKKWLLRVTANQAKDFCASYWKQKVVSMETVTTETGAFMKAEEANALYEAVMSLSSKYRPVVHLYYYEDYSVKEIAEILNIKETAVQTRLMRARQKLKNVLEEAWQDE